MSVQLCKGGDLLEAVTGEQGERQPLTYGDVARLTICILQTLESMHTQGLAHCARLSSQLIRFGGHKHFHARYMSRAHEELHARSILAGSH